MEGRSRDRNRVWSALEGVTSPEFSTFLQATHTSPQRNSCDHSHWADLWFLSRQSKSNRGLTPAFDCNLTHTNFFFSRGEKYGKSFLKAPSKLLIFGKSLKMIDSSCLHKTCRWVVCMLLNPESEIRRLCTLWLKLKPSYITRTPLMWRCQVSNSKMTKTQ